MGSCVMDGSGSLAKGRIQRTARPVGARHPLANRRKNLIVWIGNSHADFTLTNLNEIST